MELEKHDLKMSNLEKNRLKELLDQKTAELGDVMCYPYVVPTQVL